LINKKNKAVPGWLPKMLLAISIFLWIALCPVYVFQPDFLAALTFWPVWLFAIPAIIFSVSGISANKKMSMVVTFLWILFVVLIAEEPLGLLRSYTRLNRDCKNSCDRGICLRVVSFNCAGGNIAAAEEILQYAPDVVLLQESPPDKDLAILTKKFFSDGGEFVLEGDTAILARGHVTKTEVIQEKRSLMVGARVNLPSGLEIETLSIHLVPPAAGTNLLSPDCWREHFEDRKQRLQQISAIGEQVKSVADNVPIVVGGDFNAKPWLGASKILSLRLQDTFKQGGFGWPGTGPAHFPLWRIDQIWTSRNFKTVKVQSVNSKQSDHRIVICDLCKL
jgi:vancomycin resistance protein VanJ